MRADGTGYRQITDDAFRDRGPQWSPDGSRIGFYSDRSGRYETWTMQPDGSKLEQQTRTTGPSRWDSVWSPDGKRLATTDGVQTFIEDLTKPLAERKAEPLPPLEVKRALLPRSWSPDGATLAGDLEFYVSRDSVTLLYSFASRAYRALPEARGTPEWLGDSRRLLVAQHDRIVLVDTRTGRASPVLAGRRAGHQPLARRPLGHLHRAALRGRRLDGRPRAVRRSSMRRATATLIVAGLLAAPLSAQAPPPGDVARLAWLEGRWEGAQGGVAMEEHWTAPRGGALLGVHRDVKNGRMVSFEFLRIQATPEGVVYFASPNGAAVTPFKLAELGEDRVVFENRQHDFPQRILYWTDPAGALHARIEGLRGGKTVSEEWVWTRAR